MPPGLQTVNNVRLPVMVMCPCPVRRGLLAWLGPLSRLRRDEWVGLVWSMVFQHSGAQASGGGEERGTVGRDTGLVNYAADTKPAEYWMWLCVQLSKTLDQ